MNRLPDLIRFMRLCILLMFVPLIRWCSDVGITETTGFPLPYSVYSNHQLWIDNIDWLILTANFVILAMFAVFLSRRAPKVLWRLGSIRIFFAVAIYALISFALNSLLFVPLLALAMLVSFGKFEIIESLALIDVLSRIMLACVVIVAFLATKPSKHCINQSGDGG